MKQKLKIIRQFFNFLPNADKNSLIKFIKYTQLSHIKIIRTHYKFRTFYIQIIITYNFKGVLTKYFNNYLVYHNFVIFQTCNQKDFLIIGNSNAITYKSHFNYRMNNQLWLGQNCVRWFENVKGELVEGARSFWFSNIDNQKRNKKLSLNKKYNSKDYISYDNYNAIEITKTKDIPFGYSDIIGIPITFLDKYNPQQFKILGADYQVKSGELVYIKRYEWNGKTDRVYINEKRLHFRIFIKHREVNNAF